jgi:hypothetical protein
MVEFYIRGYGYGYYMVSTGNNFVGMDICYPYPSPDEHMTCGPKQWPAQQSSSGQQSNVQVQAACRSAAYGPGGQEATTRGQIQSNIQAINSLRPAPAVLDSWSRPLGLSAVSHSVGLQLQVSNPSQPPSLKFQSCSCRAAASSKPPSTGCRRAAEPPSEPPCRPRASSLLW